jgi:hypothetical protein
MKKTLIATVAFATLAATPAFAAGTKGGMHFSQRARDAYASYYYTQSDPYTVTYGDKVVGRDPDINIRAGLLRDPLPNEN